MTSSLLTLDGFPRDDIDIVGVLSPSLHLDAFLTFIFLLVLYSSPFDTLEFDSSSSETTVRPLLSPLSVSP